MSGVRTTSGSTVEAASFAASSARTASGWPTCTSCPAATTLKTRYRPAGVSMVAKPGSARCGIRPSSSALGFER